ncbi:alpha-L-rhamnosidase N-terminal domain-containing protein [Halocatena marina]|uniref:Alpha-L-rhamnosidase N-terminal domain-containing protein n=1 Tax=Halocatena marina TaxID=2934937 RepID=A0ABD5YUA8_9EURY|nr:alpha-L-rhamnosidase N-terminal domain-containing protein [Halocatena marina]
MPRHPQSQRVFRSGWNCAAAAVNYTEGTEDTRGGFFAELVDGGGECLVTVETWRITEADAWESDTFETSFSLVTTHQEHYDARQAPDGWTEVGFDDGDWRSAVAVGGTHWDGTDAQSVSAVPRWNHLIERNNPEIGTNQCTLDRIKGNSRQIREPLFCNSRNVTRHYCIIENSGLVTASLFPIVPAGSGV